MTHGSLFSGIGGFDLAAQWLGWENVFHCEWNPFGQRVLKHYWPNADSHHDITKTNFTQYANRIDILTGGFPCQPYSSAGKRKGKEDERHLWPEMLRVIREVTPRYVVGENVLGLTNWNGGLVFDEVHTDLESAGYEVAAVVIPAAAVNAPHGRDRVWFVAKRVVADANGERPKVRTHAAEIQRDIVATNSIGVATDASDNEYGLQTEGWLGMEQNPLDRRERKKETNGFGNDGEGRVATDASGERLQRRDGQNIGEFPTTHGTEKFGVPTKWETFPTKPAVCSGNDGVPDQLDGITFSKWRFESLKAYGNAIVPQVAYEIFKTIQRIEDGQTTT
jgi:DNA (cytosine-5)-methyltransferase 1